MVEVRLAAQCISAFKVLKNILLFFFYIIASCLILAGIAECIFAIYLMYLMEPTITISAFSIAIPLAVIRAFLKEKNKKHFEIVVISVFLVVIVIGTLGIISLL